ncbi:enoyl-CoA hydratase [Pseudotabrizicola algicola]|uniref:Enoyl-CoA hydratase domain-containing protein 3, mitochondrial n=1 Tax=Pseudotabrizicola algicola TaxID=2709381 RepID=A0A6B3RU49_9RHOB|nr:enoyl-CoA hydratase [Pseudotabrizicola algicola]NEX48318.1 enoyl-CoA hydratase [Pseudotabrizicola algicola]
MQDSPLLRQDSGGIATLTLNAPGSLNALSNAMLAALSGQLAALAADRSIRVVILRAEGRAFCAGHDLREMQAARAAPDQGKRAFADLFATCAQVMRAITALPQPVIAQVHGIAAAAGCQLVASCDMVVASDQARFGVNGVNIGLFCSTPMVALTRKVPPAIAFEMLTTGAFLDAARAAQVGLVNLVTPPETLGAQTRALAETVAGKLDAAVKIGKRAFYDQIGLPLEAAYAQTGEAMVENMLWRDTDEGIRAFLEKRPPDWADKG